MKTFNNSRLIYVVVLFLHLTNTYILLSQSLSFDFKSPNSITYLHPSEIIAENYTKQRIFVRRKSASQVGHYVNIVLDLYGNVVSETSDISNNTLAVLTANSLGDSSFIVYSTSVSCDAKTSICTCKIYTTYYNDNGEKVSEVDITKQLLFDLGYTDYSTLGLFKSFKVQQPFSPTFSTTNGTILMVQIGKVINDNIIDSSSVKWVCIELNSNAKKMRWFHLGGDFFYPIFWKDFKDNLYLFNERDNSDKSKHKIRKIATNNSETEIFLRRDMEENYYREFLDEPYSTVSIFPHRSNGFLFVSKAADTNYLRVWRKQGFTKGDVIDSFPSTKVVYVDSNLRILNSSILPGRLKTTFYNRCCPLQWFGESNYVLATTKHQLNRTETTHEFWFNEMYEPLRNDALIVEFDSTLQVRREVLFSGRYHDYFGGLIQTKDKSIIAIGINDFLQPEVHLYEHENNLWIVRLNENLEPNTSVGVRESSQTLSPNVVHTFYSNGVLYISDNQCSNNDSSLLTVYDVVGKEIFRGRINAQRLEVYKLVCTQWCNRQVMAVLCSQRL